MVERVIVPPAVDDSQSLRVRELLAHEILQGATLVAGKAGLDKLVLRLNVMTIPDIIRWIKEQEFLLTTGYPLPRQSEEFADLVRRLSEHGLAGLGVKLDRYVPQLPPAVIDVADEVGLPLVVIPEDVAFDDILSQVFSTIVNRQAAALAQAQEIHNAFLGIVLSGGGMQSLAGELATLLRGASVVITDQTGLVLTATPDLAAVRDLNLLEADGILATAPLTAGMHEDHESGRRWTVGVIRAGTLHHGYVVAVEGRQRFGAVALTAVDQAALIGALEITRDLAVSAVERQFASNALHDLVTSPAAEIVDTAARGVAFGWDLERPIAVLVCHHEEDAKTRRLSRHQRRLAALRAIELWTSAVRARDRHAAAAGFTTELVAIVGDGRDPEELARSVQTEMTSLTRRSLSIGVSRVRPGPGEIPRAYREARTALALGCRVSGAGSVTGFGGLGLFRLLGQVSDAELRAFAEDTLGAVLRLDPEERSDLLHTLEVLLEQHLNVAESSRILHYHYNTLRYRIAKLERLLGPFSTDPQTALHLEVALQILRMPGMTTSPSTARSDP